MSTHSVSFLHDGGDGRHGDGHGDHPMQMFFINTYHATILFEGWATHSQGAYAGSLVALFVAGVLAIYLKVLRQKLEESRIIKGRNLAVASCARTIAAFVCYSWDYLLMLVVMTFNVGIFVVSMAGLAVGYAAFGAQLSRTTKKFAEHEQRQPLAATADSTGSYVQCPCGAVMKLESTHDPAATTTKLSEMDPSCCQLGAVPEFSPTKPRSA